MAPPKRCLEFIIQIAAMIASGGALVAAIFTEMKYKNLGALTRFNIETVTEIEGINEIYLKTEATAGLVFATTGVAVLVGIIALIGRIANNRNAQSIRLFSSLYLLYTLLCFMGFVAAGVLGAFTAIDWFNILDSFLLFGTTEVENLRNSVAATSACSLLAALIYGMLTTIILFCCSANREY